MAELQETVGTVIRRERAGRQLTMRELAEQANISLVYLGEIERGKKYPSPVVLERLAEALHLEVPDLLELIAEELRGERQPQVVHAIGFTRAPRADATRRPSPHQVANAVNVVNVITLLESRTAEPARPGTSLVRGSRDAVA